VFSDKSVILEDQLNTIMKKILLTTMFTAFAVSTAAAIKIPKGVFRSSELDQARTEAAEKEVAVAYISFPENIKVS